MAGKKGRHMWRCMWMDKIEERSYVAVPPFPPKKNWQKRNITVGSRDWGGNREKMAENSTSFARDGDRSGQLSSYYRPPPLGSVRVHWNWDGEGNVVPTKCIKTRVVVCGCVSCVSCRREGCIIRTDVIEWGGVDMLKPEQSRGGGCKDLETKDGGENNACVCRFR